ncbi:hypothetical protein BDN70DRAFT_806753 [Pholiota conissans]|uniref:Uncharacterized protein n=1 Tax=Pholiota conissans TaxID=109636 RepID=A0A9P6D1F5_9AGAR|nr:hypothetical protein BDN70DRAFT_806753 [Pholiota conissans]
MPTWEVLPVGVPRTKSGKPIKCSPKNTKLNPATHKLISECVETMFCAAPPGAPVNATGLGVCFPRVCRRDEFPFGYVIPDIVTSRRKPNTTAADPLPAMCASGMFCPDDGSGCRQQVGIGARCELDRDDQCQSPPSNPTIKDADNKSVCLNQVCMAATLPLGAPCVIENTTYVGDINRGAAGGGQYTTVVIKHNCLAPGLFCDPTPPNVGSVGPICQTTKKLGESCRFNAECELASCNELTNKCTLPAETPLKIEPWHWVATILFIIASMTIASLVLLLIHRRRRFGQYQTLQAYYYEQISLRRSILALHTAAAEQQALNKAAAEKGL